MRITRLSAILFALSVLPWNIQAAPQPEAAGAEATGPGETDYFQYKSTVEYSDVFDVEYHGNYKVVTVSRPWPGAETALTYVLVQRGTPRPEVPEADGFIEIPVRSIVTMSTSYLPHLEMIEKVETLVGHDAFAWVSSPTMLQRIDSGEVKEVGSGPTVNVELILDMDPDLIMTYGQGNEWDAYPKLDEARLPYVINAEWTERTPLARAEWLKFMALFYNAEKDADEQFDAIVSEYTSLSERAAEASDAPAVFTGAPYQGTWWVSGGGSYAARLLEDAGADYVWSDDDSTGSLMLDVETVFEKAGNAEYWLNTGYWNSLEEARMADERFTEFEAYKTGRMYNNNRRMGPGGGNEYFETGPANPHWILADLIKILHPELLPDHELYYYKKLN